MKLAITSVILALLAQAQSVDNFPGSETGNCVSGRINFDKNRIYTAKSTTDFGPDPTKYDMVVKSGSLKYVDGGVTLGLNQGTGTFMALTRYLKYGKITARFTPAQSIGVVSTFVTMSAITGYAEGEAIHDEIDFEILGKDTSKPEYNLFPYTTTAIERGMHGGPIQGSVAKGVPHDFTFDWRSDRIDWLVDGQIVQSIKKSESVSKTGAIAGNGPWFPMNPSRVEFSIWAPSSDWSGGSPDYSNGEITAKYEYFDIQCYDDGNNPVPKWPANTEGEVGSSNNSNRQTSSQNVTKPAVSLPKLNTTYSAKGQSADVNNGYRFAAANAVAFVGTVSAFIASIF